MLWLAMLPSALHAALQLQETESNTELLFTENELQWLQNNKITLSVDNAYAPMNFINQRGEMDGLSIDYIKLLQQKIGYEIEFDAHPWPIALKNAMEHKSDGIINANPTQQREKQLLFTKPYINVPMVFLTHQQTPFYKSLDEVENGVILLKRKTVESETLPAKYPNLQFKEVDSYQEALQQLSLGKATGVFGHLAVLEYEMGQFFFSNIKKNFLSLDDVETHQSIGIRNTAPELVSILNKAIESLTVNEIKNLNNRWLDFQSKLTSTQQLGENTEKNIGLTAREKAFLDQHPVIKIGVDPYYPPFEFLDLAGNYQGIGNDYLQLIGDMLNVKFDIVPNLSWSEVLDGAKNKTVDVVPVLTNTPERSDYLAFTNDYIKIPQAVIGTEKSTDITSFEDLNGKSVAIPKGYTDMEIIPKKYPKINIVPVENIPAAIKAILTGEADYAYGNLAVINYYLKENHFNNISVKLMPEEMTYSHSIGVRDDWVIFRDILNKALQNMDGDAVQKIKNRWFGVINIAKQKKVNLTPEEKSWVANNTVKIGVENWRPIYFSNDGQAIEGMAGDILRLISERTG